MATSEVGGGWEFCIFLLGTWPLISQFKIFYRWFWTKKTGSDSTMFNIAYKLHSHFLLKRYVFTGNVVIKTLRRKITSKHRRSQTQSDLDDGYGCLYTWSISKAHVIVSNTRVLGKENQETRGLRKCVWTPPISTSPPLLLPFPQNGYRIINPSE